jgi:hypothetical protein
MNRAKAYATEQDDPWIALLVFTHPDLPGALRFTDGGANVTVSGDLYTYEPFKIRLPEETDDAPAVGKLVLDNVTRAVIAALRSIEGPITLDLSIVLASNPTVVERGPYEFEIPGARWNASTVDIDLLVDSAYGEMVPTDIYSPAYFPGLTR